MAEVTKIHIDTDLGGDIDDICALAMLLRWPGVEITGITVVGDTGGKRTGYTRYVLGLRGRADIPVAAGAETSQGFYRYNLGLPQEDRYWPEPIPASPNPVEDAIQLLKTSIEQQATIVGIGPFTNLYLLDRQYPGILNQARIFLMGGYVYPIRPGFPDWKNEFDFNVQADIKSARHVLENSNPTLVTISVTAETALRRGHLERLRTAGALGQLLARQAETFAEDEKMETTYGETCQHVPADIINFQHDPLACAIAAGWDEGVEIEALPLIIEERNGWLCERIAGSGESGKLVSVVTRANGPAFGEFWLNRITGGDSD
jgi:purine nucleosidase